MSLIRYADAIAEKYHAGQFRNDKKTPYITHPRAVRELVEKSFNLFADIFPIEYLLEAQIVALFHDISEEVKIPEKELIEELEQYKGEYFDKEIVFNALTILNKHNHEDYLDYILKIKRNPVARIVKLADLEHNLSDLKAGNMRGKYLLAKHILLN